MVECPWFCAHLSSHLDFFEIQNLPDLPNHLWSEGRLQFTDASLITYLSEWLLHKLVYFVIDLTDLADFEFRKSWLTNITENKNYN